MKKEIIKCPKCKGKGYLNPIDWFPAVLTFGITALMDLGWREKCDSCNGKGYIRLK